MSPCEGFEKAAANCSRQISVSVLGPTRASHQVGITPKSLGWKRFLGSRHKALSDTYRFQCICNCYLSLVPIYQPRCEAVQPFSLVLVPIFLSKVPGTSRFPITLLACVYARLYLRRVLIDVSDPENQTHSSSIEEPPIHLGNACMRRNLIFELDCHDACILRLSTIAASAVC